MNWSLHLERQKDCVNQIQYFLFYISLVYIRKFVILKTKYAEQQQQQPEQQQQQQKKKKNNNNNIIILYYNIIIIIIIIITCITSLVPWPYVSWPGYDLGQL